MVLCLDVQYHEKTAYVAAIAFKNWENERPFKCYTKSIGNVKPYKSGLFYKREMPCLLETINSLDFSIDCLIIDGYVFLSNLLEPGLGCYLYQALDDKIPVIGVAKNKFAKYDECKFIFRGESIKPLYISSIGIDIEEACLRIKNMTGKFRFPDLLKLADTNARLFCKENRK